MLTGSILQDSTILNMYAPNNRAPKYVRQKLTGLQEETDRSTTIVGYFNTLL